MAALSHERQYPAGQIPGTVDVYVHDAVPVGGYEIVDRVDDVHRGIVDENVYAAESFDDLLNDLVDMPAITRVHRAAEDVGVRVVGGDRLGDLFGTSFGYVCDHDTGSPAGETTGDGLPYADACRAGHQCDRLTKLAATVRL